VRCSHFGAAPTLRCSHYRADHPPALRGEVPPFRGAAQLGWNVTRVTKVNDFSRAEEVDPRG